LSGGYTPQLLCRLVLANGRRVVLKAAAASTDAPGQMDWISGRIDWATVLRAEIRAYRVLPMLAAGQPEILADFEEAGWVALLLEDLSNAARIASWTGATVDLVACDLAAMHAVTYQTSPPPGLNGSLLMEPFFDRIAARGRKLGNLPSAWDTPATWARLNEACRVGVAAMEAGFTNVPYGVIPNRLDRVVNGRTPQREYRAELRHDRTGLV